MAAGWGRQARSGGACRNELDRFNLVPTVKNGVTFPTGRAARRPTAGQRRGGQGGQEETLVHPLRSRAPVRAVLAAGRARAPLFFSCGSLSSMPAGSLRAAPGGAPAGRRRSLAAVGSLSTELSLPPPGAPCPREVWAAWQAACRLHGAPVDLIVGAYNDALLADALRSLAVLSSGGGVQAWAYAVGELGRARRARGARGSLVTTAAYR